MNSQLDELGKEYDDQYLQWLEENETEDVC